MSSEPGKSPRWSDPYLLGLMEKAAKELPKGWYIEIHIEKESGYADLINPEGENVEYPSNMESLEEQVSDAFDYAIQEAGKQ